MLKEMQSNPEYLKDLGFKQHNQVDIDESDLEEFKSTKASDEK